MDTGRIYSGFRLLRVEWVQEVNAQALIFEHEVTGARLLKLSCDDNNKVFGIGFRTPPKDSTGVAHIVEHCVLSGSRKYKTKEPFMDLYKGSLQTFLNAMTFGDKTIYPVASRNDTDFRNLMDVYLDAVLYPAIGEIREIFMQEGWHYELFHKEDPIIYRGVVYNEMRGAMSAPEDQVDEFIDQSLFPDTVYSNHSGGDPYEIPNLSYEAFLDFHRNYYHPSNSYIFLYGDGDTEAELDHIQEYLQDFDRLEIDSEIPMQPLFEEPRRESYEYSTTDEVDGLDRDFLVYNVLFGESINGLDRRIADLLKEALVDSDAAPIKRALLDKGMGEDIYSSGYAVQQLPFSIIVKNTSARRQEEFETTIQQVLQGIVRKGLDERLMISTLNKYEYHLREGSGYSTRGIIYFIEAFKSWLYGGDPLEALRYEKEFQQLREGIKNGLFERYIQDRLLDNNHKTILSVTPNVGLNEQRDREVAGQLAAYKSSLTEAQLEELIRESEALNDYQSAPDTPEAKSTIPRLSLDEVTRKLEEIPREEIKVGETTILYHEQFTGGINYLDLVFDISHIKPEDVPLVALLGEMLGSVGTRKLSYGELTKEIFIQSGGINFKPVVYSAHQDEDEIYPKFFVSTKVLGNDLSKVLELIQSILTESVLDQSKRFKEIVQEIKSGIEMSIFQNGHMCAASRAKSYLIKSAKYNELINGFDFFDFIQETEKALKSGGTRVMDQIQRVYWELLTRQGLILNLTGDRAALDSLQENLSKLLEIIPNTRPLQRLDGVGLNVGNEGIQSSANVQYVSKTASLKEMDIPFTGKLTVLTSLLSREYLHNNIRARGGAYGAGIAATRGAITTYSYRDPNLEETIKVYDEMGDYLENLELSQEDLTSLIIGTLGKFDPPLTAQAKGALDLSMYIAGYDNQTIEGYIEEAMSTTLEDLRAFAKPLTEGMEKNHLCVLGSMSKIKENADLFDEIVDLKK
ncbi:MAG: insulinase family protein [Tissierellia bacterium]|nr:insulinase family protein [Tissierellia bacterium]